MKMETGRKATGEIQEFLVTLLSEKSHTVLEGGWAIFLNKVTKTDEGWTITLHTYGAGDDFEEDFYVGSFSSKELHQLCEKVHNEEEKG